jgi:tetratricopeptide (TPR) repeat protein
LAPKSANPVFWGIIKPLAPTLSGFEVYEVTHALDLIRRKGKLPLNEFKLLSYAVDQVVTGCDSNLSQKTIAEDVFGRDITQFDPRSDSIVRTTATNLRQNLMSYYEGPGQTDPLMVELPRGTYSPRFARRPQLSPSSVSRLWSARVALEARTVSGYAVAVKHLDGVLAESPNLSLALALKAEALASQAIHGARPRPALEEARDFALRAIDQERPVWQAWLAHGIVRQALDWDWATAESAYGKALEISAGEAATHVWYTAFLVGRGRPREAIAHLQRNVDHFGYSNPTYIGDLSMLLMLAGDYSNAATAIEAAIEAAPAYYQHRMNHAILLEALGDPAGALRVLDQTPLRIHERPVTWGLRALFAGLAGSPPMARRRLSWLRAIQKTGRYVPPSQLAACWLGAGDPDRAVECLEAAADDRDPLAVWFHAYPFFRHLHAHEGFRRLIDRMGLVWLRTLSA